MKEEKGEGGFSSKRNRSVILHDIFLIFFYMHRERKWVISHIFGMIWSLKLFFPPLTLVFDHCALHLCKSSMINAQTLHDHCTTVAWHLNNQCSAKLLHKSCMTFARPFHGCCPIVTQPNQVRKWTLKNMKTLFLINYSLLHPQKTIRFPWLVLNKAIFAYQRQDKIRTTALWPISKTNWNFPHFSRCETGGRKA